MSKDWGVLEMSGEAHFLETREAHLGDTRPAEGSGKEGRRATMSKRRQNEHSAVLERRGGTLTVGCSACDR